GPCASVMGAVSGAAAAGAAVELSGGWRANLTFCPVAPDALGGACRQPLNLREIHGDLTSTVIACILAIIAALRFSRFSSTSGNPSCPTVTLASRLFPRP